MTTSIGHINDMLEPTRLQLLKHPVYTQMSSLRHVQIFMEHHVYAVWDFMSLLKALQRKFGCFRIPWTPSDNPDGVRLLNEIAVAEESDEGLDGTHRSHFSMYRSAMAEAGASTEAIDRLVEVVDMEAGCFPDLKKIALSDEARQFVGSTFEVIARNDSVEMASTFLYGREDLLPGLFTKIVEQVSEEHAGKLDQFVYYLNRHIEVDEGEHGPAAERLLAMLCDGKIDRIERAQKAASEALRQRMLLWDGIAADYNRSSSDTEKELV